MTLSPLTYDPSATAPAALRKPDPPSPDLRGTAFRLAVYCEEQRRWSMTQCQGLECAKGAGKQMERQMRHVFRIVDWWTNPCRAVGVPGEWSESDYAIQLTKESNHD